MKSYYNKYLEEYKKRVDPKSRWLRYISKKERCLYYGTPICFSVLGLIDVYMLWRMCNLLKESKPNAEMSYLVEFVIAILISCVIGGVVWRINEKFIIRKKDEIAVKIYKLESWNEKDSLDKETFKCYLRSNKVKTEKQIDMVLKSIDDEIAKKSKYNIVGASSFLVFLLAVWNEQVKLMYKYQEANNIWMLFIILVTLLFAVWFIIIVLVKYLYDMKELKISKLKGMKNILLEMYLEVLGKE